HKRKRHDTHEYSNKKPNLLVSGHVPIRNDKDIGTYRWIYNRCLELVKQDESMSRDNLRIKVLNNNNYEYDNTWVKDTPKDNNLVSINPDIRSFIIYYDPSRKIIEYNKGDAICIYHLCKKYDKYQSERSKLKGGSKKRRRYTIRRKMLRIHDKIKNLIKDCHYKIAKDLCKNYNTILLPRFETKNMVRKKKSRFENQESEFIKAFKKNLKRKINSKTMRMMLKWSHFSFQQHLIHKIREYPIYVQFRD
ncbi:8727_t:CDS:2, partial [Scutellospora calospora]